MTEIYAWSAIQNMVNSRASSLCQTGFSACEAQLGPFGCVVSLTPTVWRVQLQQFAQVAYLGRCKSFRTRTLPTSEQENCIGQRP